MVLQLLGLFFSAQLQGDKPFFSVPKEREMASTNFRSLT